MSLVSGGGGESLMEAMLSMVEGGRGRELLMEDTSPEPGEATSLLCFLPAVSLRLYRPPPPLTHRPPYFLLHVHPSPQACANKCVFCWRHHSNPVGRTWKWAMDGPQDIVNQVGGRGGQAQAEHVGSKTMPSLYQQTVGGDGQQLRRGRCAWIPFPH